MAIGVAALLVLAVGLAKALRNAGMNKPFSEASEVKGTCTHRNCAFLSVEMLTVFHQEFSIIPYYWIGSALQEVHTVQ